MCRIAGLLLISLALLPAQSIVPRKTALVIGNAHYRFAPGIPTASNDADDMAAALRAKNFDLVEVYKDLSLEDMTRSVLRFAEELRAGDLAVFYYSGHAGQAEGNNYLLPVDFQPPADTLQVAERAFRISFLRDALERSAARVRVLIFEVKGRGGDREELPEGTLIARSNQGDPVRTGDRNSLYTGELVKALREEDGELRSILEEVGRRISARTDGRQVPYLNGSARASQ
jgi:uncharacterized caspase-like protein